MGPEEFRLAQGYLAAGSLARGVAAQRVVQRQPFATRPLAPHVANALGGGQALLRKPSPAALRPPPSGPTTTSYIPLPYPAPSATAFGPGARLPHALRSRAEDYFATDLSGLQLYSSSRLASHGVQALTLGSRLIFAPGYSDPAHSSGRALIAHELAHVVQQRRGRLQPPAQPGFFLVRDPRLDAEAQAAGRSFGGPWHGGAVQPSLRLPQAGQGGVIQRANGDWFNDGRLEVRELHGRNRGDSAIFLSHGDNEAFLTYDLEADGTTVIIPHIEALNFEGGHGAGWLLFRVFADHALSLGRTHVRLGTAVYRNPSNTHGPTNAAVHIYETLGFDVTSSQSVLASRIDLNQIRQRAGQNALRYHWVGGRLPSAVTPLIGNDNQGGGCFPNCRCYLTTACVEHFGLAVDGEELTVLRSLRDGYMSATDSRRGLLEQYYATAPSIVEELQRSPERDEAYAWIFEVIRRCVGLLRDGGQDRAMRVYGSAVATLEGRFLADRGPELPEPGSLFHS